MKGEPLMKNTYGTRAPAIETAVVPYQTYAKREGQRKYGLEHIGRARTLLERERRQPPAVHPKVEAAWDGPLFFDVSPDPTRPYVLLMFVRDLAGKVTFDNPGDIGGGETDWWLYREAVRLEMDAVGGGAGTLRGSGITFSLYDPELVAFRTDVLKKPRHPVQVVITGSGRLDAAREYVLKVPEFATVVLTSTPGAARLEPLLHGRPGKYVLPIGSEERALDFAHGFRILRQKFEVERMLIVGGAEVATALLEARLVDEIFLTQSARLLGGAERKTIFEGNGFTPEGAPTARLMTAKIGVRDEQTLFLRYRLT